MGSNGAREIKRVHLPDGQSVKNKQVQKQQDKAITINNKKNEPDIGLKEIGKAVRALKGWETCGNISRRNGKSQKEYLW